MMRRNFKIIFSNITMPKNVFLVSAETHYQALQQVKFLFDRIGHTQWRTIIGENQDWKVTLYPKHMQKTFRREKEKEKCETVHLHIIRLDKKTCKNAK